ncbi:MAG: polysaccharide biosynthesis C-terminal domain-containing protein [Lachnospiraceae bacterium]|nr:polysaccharide biosynthesis C-terminal domain-containing protein [Lachnospiraceae bacterium]
MGNKIKSIIKNEYIYSIVTKFVSVILSLLQSILVARYLGSALQGTSSYIASVTSIGAIVVTFGMHQAYPYFRKKLGKEAIFKDFISITYVVYSILFILSVFIGLFFLNTIELKAAFILIPVYGYDRVISYIALIETPNKRNTWWTIISFIDVIYVGVLILFIPKSVGSAISILAFAEVLKSAVYTVMLKTAPSLKKSQWSLFFKLLKMGFFPVVALLMTTLNYKIDILMLKSFDFITKSQIGIYSIGMTFADRVVIIPDTLKGVLASKLSKGADEAEVARVCRLCFWCSVVICAGLIALGEPLLNLLYGEEYYGSYDVLLICSFGSIFIGYFKLIAQYNIVNKMQIRNVLMLSISIIVNIVLNSILIPKYQLRGAAFASGVGYFLSGAIFIIWFSVANKIPFNSMFLINKNDIKSIFKSGEKQK